MRRLCRRPTIKQSDEAAKVYKYFTTITDLLLPDCELSIWTKMITSTVKGCRRPRVSDPRSFTYRGAVQIGLLEASSRLWQPLSHAWHRFARIARKKSACHYPAYIATILPPNPLSENKFRSLGVSISTLQKRLLFLYASRAFIFCSIYWASLLLSIYYISC